MSAAIQMIQERRIQRVETRTLGACSVCGVEITRVTDHKAGDTYYIYTDTVKRRYTDLWPWVVIRRCNGCDSHVRDTWKSNKKRGA